MTLKCCFTCDGDGYMCAKCGNSAAWCDANGACGDDPPREKCTDCGGSGEVDVDAFDGGEHAPGTTEPDHA